MYVRSAPAAPPPASAYAGSGYSEPVPAWAATARMPQPAPAEPAAELPAAAGPRTLGEAEIDLIRAAVDAAQGNISLASKQLGISRNTIYRKLRWAQKP